MLMGFSGGSLVPLLEDDMAREKDAGDEGGREFRSGIVSSGRGTTMSSQAVSTLR